eukprot:Em0018g966a
MYIAEMMRTFHCLPACDRIDLLCRLLRHCTYYEAMFVGHVMADVSASQVKENPALEGNANRTNYYAVFKQTGLTHEVCEKLCHALALLHPNNRPVAEVVFNLLDDSRILTSFRDTSDLSVLDDYRLLYVMAVNHPVLSFGQRHHLMYTYLQAMDVLYSAKIKLDTEVTSSLSPMEVELQKTDSISGNGEAPLSLAEPLPFPEALPGAYITRVDVHGVYKRPSDKRFIYIIQLLDLFPEESGQKNKKQRIIPYLPGKKIITNKSSRELAEKRLPELAKYAKELITLPNYMLCSSHVLEFFRPRICDVTEAFPPLHKITNLQDLQQEPGKIRQSSDSNSAWPSPSSGQDSPPRPDVGLERLSKTLPFPSTNIATSAGSENAKLTNSPLERRSTYPARQAKVNGFAPPAEEHLHGMMLGGAVIPHHASERSRSPSNCPLPENQHTAILGSPSQPLSPTHTLTPVQDFLSTSHDCIPSGSPPHPAIGSASMPDLSADCVERPNSGQHTPQLLHASTPGLSVPNQGPFPDANPPNISTSNCLLPATFPQTSVAPVHSTSTVSSAPTFPPPPLPLPVTLSVGPHSISVHYRTIPPSQSLHPLPAHTAVAQPAPSHVTAPNSSTAASMAMPPSVSMATHSLVSTATLSPFPVAPITVSVPCVVSSVPDVPLGGVTSPQDSSLRGLGPLLHMGSSSSIPNISSFCYGSPLPSPLTSSPNTPYLMGSTGSVVQDSDSLPKWLKRHRLHKYAKIFNGMTFEESAISLQMQLLTEENLKEKGMTAGAAKKLRLKLDELGRFNFSGCQEGSMKSSTCSLPAALLAERGLTHSSSCDLLTPYDSTASLDQSNETTSLVALPSSAPKNHHHHHHHHHRRAESLGVIPVLTDAAIVKVVQRDSRQKSSEGATPSPGGGSRDPPGDQPMSAAIPETSNSSQDSGISRTSLSAVEGSSNSWADQSLKGAGESDPCLPSWARLHKSSPNISSECPQNGSPVLTHSCPPLPQPHQNHSGHFHHAPAVPPQHPPFVSMLGGKYHAPVHKRHSSDAPSSSDAVHIQLIHQMVPPLSSHGHLPFGGNSWQAIRPIIVPGTMQLPRGAPHGGQVPILSNGVMACAGPMQHMGRVPIVFTGCMMPHPQVSHGRTTQNMTCFNCGKKGHLGSSCPSSQAFHHDAARTKQPATTARDNYH